MNRFAGFVVASALFAGLCSMEGTETKKCDLKTVEKGLYCAECDEILAPEDITREEYCKACYDEATEAGTTPKKARKVDVCVKTYYRCPECFAEQRTAGHCKECDVDLEKVVSRARVIFACENCGKEFDKAGMCDEEDCREAKAKVERTCTESGTFPHTTD